MTRFSMRRARLLVAAGTVLCFASPAHAQREEPASGQEPAPGDIVVTAQKRAERLIDTPQSISALSSDDLTRIAARQFVDFANTVPGLQYTSQGAGTSQISLRGVTSGADVSSTVGIYVDEVPYGSSSAFANGARRALDVGLFDIDRVEVLRGPQGTLYGASAMGGVLKYVMAKPSLTAVEGKAQAGLSTTRSGGTSYDASAVVNAPLVTDKVAVRASGYYSRDGGYFDNVVTGEKNVDRGEVYGGRVDLLAAPTDALSIRLTGFAQDVRRDGGSYASIGLDGAPVTGYFDQGHPLREPFRSDFRLGSATIDYDFGPVALTSITSYQTNKTYASTDGSAVYALYLQILANIPAQAVAVNELARTRKFTQEIRLASASGQAIEWLVGGFYTHENSLLRQVADTYGDGLVLLPDVNAVSAAIASTYDEYAVFGNLTWHLTDAFDVGGGLRYAHNDQKFTQDASGILVVSAPGSSSSEGVVTYLANARYRLSRNATAYARFATGYRPGGPNFRVVDPVTNQPSAPTFRSDSLDSYEIGVKADTADRSFGIDLSGYYIDWKNIQLLSPVAGVTNYTNGPGAHIKGAELTMTARPGRGFVATGAFAYNDGKLTEDVPLLGARKGERLPNTPHVTAAVNVDYTVMASPLRPTVGGTLRFASDSMVSFDASPALRQYRVPDYATLGLRAGATFGPVDAQVYVQNLFDTHGQLAAQTILSQLGGPAQVLMLRPRTLGLRLTSRF
ncbi:TonB-dependent receptor [Sphingomonas sp.]|uniref:TonB-dependent receptor n=1 Tax=Sphingomonas sp. TaxID=28214 RepID=UPI002BA5217F|nr:TonB-dependent receptor [Sphingomonas sp.]HWK36809.1 TonB-dependent receptor [Sphingomonas sp.]